MLLTGFWVCPSLVYLEPDVGHQMLYKLPLATAVALPAKLRRSISAVLAVTAFSTCMRVHEMTITSF